MSERYSRQKDIVPERVKDIKIAVIGVGAIGRNVSLQLASIGVENLTIVDFDKVEEHNIASQGFSENEIEKPKIEAVKTRCEQINSQIKVNAIDDRYRPFHVAQAEVIFCCVDSMEIREVIFKNLKGQLFIDGRMAAESMRIFTVDQKPESKKHYKDNLFADSEAYVGTCTAKTTIYCANVASALMVSSFTKWLREFPLDKEINFNILTSEIGVKE
jgi:sulfur carrier protein ThiS adenylyltransferase